MRRFTGIIVDQRENRSAYNKEHYALRREEILESKRLYRKKNQGRIREYARKHYWENREYYLRQSSKYIKLHPEKAVNYVAKRRMLSYHNGKYEVINRNVVFTRDEGICWICESAVKDKWELDHKIPLSKGGTHTYDNVGVAHRSCNARKAVKILNHKAVMPVPVEMVDAAAA